VADASVIAQCPEGFIEAVGTPIVVTCGEEIVAYIERS
jgi:hypothetical protein